MSAIRATPGGRGWTDQREGSPGERATDRGFAEAAPAPATQPLNLCRTYRLSRLCRKHRWLLRRRFDPGRSAT